MARGSGNCDSRPLACRLPSDRERHGRPASRLGLTEIVGNDGRVYISGPGPAKLDATEISVVAIGGNAQLVSLEAHELSSIWDNR